MNEKNETNGFFTHEYSRDDLVWELTINLNCPAFFLYVHSTLFDYIFLFRLSLSSISISTLFIYFDLLSVHFISGFYYYYYFFLEKLWHIQVFWAHSTDADHQWLF